MLICSYFTVKPIWLKWQQLLVATLCCIILPLKAETLTQVQLIQQVAEFWVQEHQPLPKDARVTIKANPLDKRLSHPKCQSQLVASAPGNQGSGRYITVKVRCPDAEGWSVYVPVKVRIQYPVVTTSALVAANTLLESHMLTIEYRDASSLRGNHFSSVQQLSGTRLLRRVGEGQILRNNNICHVCRGDMVTIIAQSQTLQLKTTGEAMSSGTIGDTIQVQNSRSKRIVDAKISTIGVVEVNL